jgi:predicted aspartyl protease
MLYTTEIKLVNREDVILAERGFIKPEDVRQTIVREALVDTGASRLSLPQPLIQQLGLTPVGKTRSKTANGEVDRTIYSEVEFTILGRADSMKVTDLPDDVPVLVGHIVMELLDLCLDIQHGLIYNPAHDGEWIENQL